MGTRFQQSVALAFALVGFIFLTGCSVWSGGEARCTATTISPSLREVYSLPELPKGADEIRICEASDKDGSWAQLTFKSQPDETVAYLKSLDMDPAKFAPVPPKKMNELTDRDGDGWELTKGLDYKRGGRSINYNGHCLVHYKAYVQNTAEWDGRVYLGIYCAN
ncbi:hypothetical protein [Streptomyces sp. 147326]|uniref:hypothetical protein n=1 Tax=Streptomyces sp. 147326 TaxID=3074379 RepID=UPI00385739A2